jgi:CO/xanthine dehydrogenase Mo-binding subunit
MTQSSMIGRRIPKMDAQDKATGRITYGHDVRLPGMLTAAFSMPTIPTLASWAWIPPAPNGCRGSKQC